jgi:hypothetical protein
MPLAFLSFHHSEAEELLLLLLLYGATYWYANGIPLSFHHSEAEELLLLLLLYGATYWYANGIPLSFHYSEVENSPLLALAPTSVHTGFLLRASTSYLLTTSHKETLKDKDLPFRKTRCYYKKI